MGMMHFPGAGIIISDYLINNPANFQEMYDQDIAQGWGLVHKQGAAQFKIDASVILVSGYFVDTNKMVEFADEARFEMSGNTHFRLGEVDSISNRTGKNGCIMVFYPYPGQSVFKQSQAAGLELYNSQIIYESGDSGNGIMILYAEDAFTFRIWGSRLRGGEYVQIGSNYSEGKYAFARTDIEDFYYGLMLAGDYSSTFFIDVRMIDCYSAIYFLATSGATVYGLEGVGLDILAYFSSATGTYNFINCKSNTWSWHNISQCTVNRQYNFDLKVPNIDGNPIGNANVKIWDVSGGNPVVDVDTYPVGHVNEGEIPIQILTNKVYPGDVMKTPHTMGIKKSGYDNYRCKFILDKEIDWNIKLDIPKNFCDAVIG